MSDFIEGIGSFGCKMPTKLHMGTYVKEKIGFLPDKQASILVFIVKEKSKLISCISFSTEKLNTCLATTYW